MKVNKPMVKTVGTSAPQYRKDQYNAKNDAEVNTDNLSPEAARRLKRFTGLVEQFEKAASSGAISPPLLGSKIETQA